MLNQARLKVLKVREDHVRAVLDEARKRLGEVTRDQGKYAEIIKTLVLQGLYQVNYSYWNLIYDVKFFIFTVIWNERDCKMQKSRSRIGREHIRRYLREI